MSEDKLKAVADAVTALDDRSKGLQKRMDEWSAEAREKAAEAKRRASGETGGAFGKGTATGRPNQAPDKHPNSLASQPEHKGRWK